MNPSGIINISARKSTQGLFILRGCTQFVHSKNRVGVSVFCANPRQCGTSEEYSNLPGATSGRTAFNLLERCVFTKGATSQFLNSPQYQFARSRQVIVSNGSPSRRFSTANTTFKHLQERENCQSNSGAENGLFKSSVDEVDEESGTSNETDEYLSPEQWKSLKDEWIKQKTGQAKEVFEARTMGALCKHLHLQKGRSLMEFVRQEGIPLTYSLMGSYLYLCVRQGDESELFSVHDWFAANHPVQESGVLTNFITGFCQTSRWRESLNFLQDMKRVAIPTARNYHSLISTACDHHDYDLVKDLLQDIYSLGIIPSEKTCIKLFQVFHCETTDLAVYDQSAKIVNDLLWYLRSKRSYPSMAVGSELQRWFCRKKGEEWKTTMTRVDKSGRCRSCHSKLESLEISQEDFLNLRHQIIEKVIKGGDVFQKTRPDELEAFMEFVNEGAPYDVIVDGLNVARMKQNKQPSKLLRQLVAYLSKECGLKCLVLGRQHMLRHSQIWCRQHMDVIQEVADCFFTENVSEDDPFMLYATLHSGPKACYISRDMLRDHKALLDPPTHLAFIKWQRGHQMYPLDFKGGKAIFRARTVHDTIAQYSDSTWHIPCDDGSPRFSYQVPLDWLCAKQVK